MPRLEPPPERKEREHHGLGLGIFIGALVGLLIGALVLLVFELTRRDALEEVRNVLQEQSNKPASVPTPQEATANSVELPRPIVVPDTNDAPVTNTIPARPVREELTVVSTSPRADATSVPADSDIVLTFSSSMDADILNSSTVSLYENSKNISAQMDYRYREESKQLTIRFDDASRKFAAGAVVQLIVSREVQSATGESLTNPFSLEFTIEK